VRLFPFIAAAILAGCAHLDSPPRHEIVGYYPNWKGAIDVDAGLLTVVNYAFLDICWDGEHGNPAVERRLPCPGPDGAMTLDDPAVDAPQLDRLAALKAKNPHLRLVGSVGGWSRSNRFSDMAAARETRAAFIDSVVAFLRQRGFDGIDIDWEYPGAIGIPCAAGFTCDRPADKRNFVALARELRVALDAAGAADGKRYLSTIAAGADRSFAFDGASAAWLAELAASLDWINLMTYDYHGTWETRAGLLAPLRRDPADPEDRNVEATVTMFVQAGIAPRKLTLGLPFYPKGWSGCEPGARGDGLYQACVAALPEPIEIGPGHTRYWNAAAQVPYLYNASTRTFITLDDADSVRIKMGYLRERGLLGAMYWEIAADRDHVLARVVAEALDR